MMSEYESASDAVKKGAAKLRKEETEETQRLRERLRKQRSEPGYHPETKSEKLKRERRQEKRDQRKKDFLFVQRHRGSDDPKVLDKVEKLLKEQKERYK
jgi:Arc/MetJ-type ribon-helix-helix transcriptional regulator